MSFNHFDYVPSTIDRRRSVFKYDKPVASCAFLGYLYPVCKPERMMPGSSISLNISAEVRSGALVAPLMDELYFDLFAFFVPNRIVWEHWKQFLGAVDTVLFNNLTSYQIPSFKYGNGAAFTTGSETLQWNQTIACHFGLQYPGTGLTQVANGIPISALPFRGYTFIWNEYFRPEQIVSPQNINVTDDGWKGANMDLNLTYYTSIAGNTYQIPYPQIVTASTQTKCYLGGSILQVFRAHRNLWLSCLPFPSLETLNLFGNLQAAVGIQNNGTSSISSGSHTTNLTAAVSTGTFGQFKADGSSTAPVVADLSTALLTVNNYRETIMLQNYYDVLNRAGSRYDEILFNIFGTRSSSAVTDIPELIVHKRFTIYRREVVALANSADAGGNVEPIGSQSSYIDTVIHDDFFTRSTTEHGYIHMLYAIRPAHVRHVQGIEPEWTQLDKMSLYYPQFDGMGDVARRGLEYHYGFGSTYASQKDGILGYQEYGAEWKYQRGEGQGYLALDATTKIPGYIIDESYNSAPALSQSFLSCEAELNAFGYCLALPNANLAPQFIVDIRLNGTITHPMPTYNIPGLGALL